LLDPWHHAQVKTTPKRKATATPKAKLSAKTSKKAQKPASGRKPATGKVLDRRADFGAPIDAFFDKHPPNLRAVLVALRKLAEEAAPDATASIKWGMPFYSIGPSMMCALAGFKSHVNLILSGPPETFADPGGLLEGDGKTGRHLKLRTVEELPREATRAWLVAAAQLARKKAR
jgi:hypothetical protein